MPEAPRIKTTGLLRVGLLLFAALAALYLLSAGQNNESDPDKTDPQSSAPPPVAEGEKAQREPPPSRRLAYIVSDIRIPFWDIMRRGVRQAAKEQGYEVVVCSAENSRKKELEETVRVIREGVDGIVVSPTSSSACATVLKLTSDAGIPVVISDIGTEGGEYVSYISSDNRTGALDLGRILCERMKALGWDAGTVGIVAIPQERLNGQARTAGFSEALNAAGIRVSGLRQQSKWTEEETYLYCKEFIEQDPRLRAIWLQGSDRYKGALRAITEAGKSGEVLLLTFDAEPEFVDLIRQEVILGAAMQQPYRMGQEAVRLLVRHLNGEEVPQKVLMPILAISRDNIEENLADIQKYVLGLEPSTDNE